MIKGFIEVHIKQDEIKPVLINVSHIRDIWGCEIYIGDDFTNYIDCVETYEEIKQKIKDATEMPMAVDVMDGRL